MRHPELWSRLNVGGWLILGGGLLLAGAFGWLAVYRVLGWFGWRWEP